jgi:predicted phage terminase large subunit-like protein
MIGYVSYNRKISVYQTKKAVQIFKKFNPNVKLLSDVEDLLLLESGGGLITSSIEGGLTGYPFDLLIIDDPIENRRDAESATMRQHLHDWWDSVADTRIRENKTSVIIVQTRWHKDDLIGYIEKIDKSIKYINLPAIDIDNKPLYFSLDFYEKKKLASPYSFYSLYQGEPIAKQGKLFKDFNYTDTLPNNYKIGIGIDLAYTQKTNSDYSCYVVTLLDLDTQNYIVIEADHWQTEINESIIKLQRLQARYPNTRIVVEKNGVQKAIYDMLLRAGLKVQGIEPRGDKYTRVLDVSSKWNTNKVLVYNNNNVKSLFIEQIADFTGINDLHDDYIDALNYSFTNIKNPNNTQFAIL